MIIGVTGSRHGMTDGQRAVVIAILTTVSAGSELHHGDCMGVDAQVAELAAALGFRTIAHPPTDPKLRAFHRSDEVRPECDYLRRDRHIVDACQLLIGVPDGPPRPKSGTWYTINYARKVRRPMLVVESDVNPTASRLPECPV